MDHPLPAPDALIRPWRTAAFVAGTVALVELVLLLGIGGGTLLQSFADRVERAAAERSDGSAAQRSAKRPARRPASSGPVLPRTKTRVLVLNGNGRHGAAAAAAARIARRGYRISAAANAPRSDYARSIVMYRPGFTSEGKRFGHDVGVRLVTPLDGMRARQLQGAHVVLILGA